MSHRKERRRAELLSTIKSRGTASLGVASERFCGVLHGGDDERAGIWNRPFDVDLDGDGRLDAIGLDLDGDGLRDDALADFDGDDVADHAVFDVISGGTPERLRFIDDGSGTWAVAVDRGGQLRWYGLATASSTPIHG